MSNEKAWGTVMFQFIQKVVQWGSGGQATKDLLHQSFYTVSIWASLCAQGQDGTGFGRLVSVKRNYKDGLAIVFSVI